MNVKFRMPKFQNMKSVKGFLREMTMTTIATTISIVLTFGTRMWLEYRKEVKESRQMAMMVTHDMYENLIALNLEAKKEQRHFAIASYVMDHLDRIETFSNDTLSDVWIFLAEKSDLTLDESNERIFNSSQETWKTLDNPTFISLVQTFYTQRHYYFSVFENDCIFRKPFTEDDMLELSLQVPGYQVSDSPEMIKKLLSEERVKYYIRLSSARGRYYEQIAAEWQRLQDKAQFIMGITDEELEEYIAKQDERGLSVKEKDLYGDWAVTAIGGDDSEEITFSRDHSFVHHTTKHFFFPIMGDVMRHHYLKGTWTLEGDSLIREYASGAYYEFDFSQISYADEMKDSVEHFIAENQAQIAELNEAIKDRSLGRRASMVTIDKSGNKIEFARMETDDDGQKQVKTNYITRVK